MNLRRLLCWHRYERAEGMPTVAPKGPRIATGREVCRRCGRERPVFLNVKEFYRQ